MLRTLGGGAPAISDGINRLQSRLTKLTAAGRRLSHEANSAAGPSGVSGEPPPTPVSQALVAQLEAQERHMAAWFADLQWQLEGIFSSQQSRMPAGSGGGGGKAVQVDTIQIRTESAHGFSA